jgi:hypothetical protein
MDLAFQKENHFFSSREKETAFSTASAAFSGTGVSRLWMVITGWAFCCRRGNAGGFLLELPASGQLHRE